jgi:hypothetical protein
LPLVLQQPLPNRLDQTMPARKIMEFARPIALVVLLIVTSVGVYTFATGDWTDVVEYWREHAAIIPMLIGFSILDVILESSAWMWSYARLNISAFNRPGATIYLAGRAGLLMPAQLGRLIRPDAMVRLGRASMTDCLKAEAVMFVLDGVSVLALLIGLLVFKVNTWLAIPATLAVAVVMVYPGDKLAELLAHTKLDFPAKFWWSWPTMGIVTVQMAGWVAHGLALFVVVATMPGAMTLWDSLFFAPSAAVIGTGTGLPGGIGATEGILGASLRFRQVPVEHLAIAVAAFRLITFWVWIPIGWLALLAVKRHRASLSPAENAGGLAGGDKSE